MKKFYSHSWFFHFVLVHRFNLCQDNKERIVDSLLRTVARSISKLRCRAGVMWICSPGSFSIDDYKGNEVHAYANRKEFSRFLGYHYNYTVSSHPGTLIKS